MTTPVEEQIRMDFQRLGLLPRALRVTYKYHTTLRDLFFRSWVVSPPQRALMRSLRRRPAFTAALLRRSEKSVANVLGVPLHPSEAPLTVRQRQFLRIFVRLYVHSGLPPSRRELQKALGSVTPNAVECLVRPLITKGYLVQLTANRARALVPTQKAISECDVKVCPHCHRPMGGVGQ